MYSKTLEKCAIECYYAIGGEGCEFKKDGYRPRLIDDKIARYLKIFGAVSIEGSKWCGKTWTGLNHANSVTYMTEKSQKDMAGIDPKYIFSLKNRS